jgi:hypothetical protein
MHRPFEIKMDTGYSESRVTSAVPALFRYMILICFLKIDCRRAATLVLAVYLVWTSNLPSTMQLPLQSTIGLSIWQEEASVGIRIPTEGANNADGTR